MQELKAITGHNYGGKYRKKGQRYKASDRHARLLITVGKAVAYTAPPPKPEPPKPAPRRRTRSASTTYQTRQLKADDSDE